MKNFTQKFLVLILMYFIITANTSVKAQWNMNPSVNLEISGLMAADMQSVPTTDGKLWVAFYSENTGNYDMRAQLFDAAGTKLLGPDGVLVSNQTSGSATFVFNACNDGLNNLIISMQDERTGTMQAVLYKISQTGAHLWSPNGVVLGNGLAPWSAALTNGEVVSAWIGDNTLSLQKITTGGALAWASPVEILVSGSTTTRGQIVANLNNRFTIVYQKSVGGISTNLYAQQFNSSGTALYTPLQICNQTTAPYRYYSVMAEADTTYVGFYASTGMRFNAFVQRINPNGTIPWGMNGSNFNTNIGATDNYQMEPSICLTPGSPYVWEVSSFCDPNQTNYGVYIQKFLKTTGARQLSDQAKVVYPISASRDIQAGDLSLINDAPTFMSYNSDYKIFATRLNSTGNFAWPYNRVEISSTSAGAGNPKGRFRFGHVGPDMHAGMWTEDRGSGNIGYAQNITIGGLFGLDVATQGSVPATITTGAGTLQMTSTVFPSYASQAVTWSIVPGTGAAAISPAGLVTAVADGIVYAKATSVQDITVKDSLMITITGQIPVAPTVVTLPASDVAFSTAILHGSINANYFTSSSSFEWGLTNTYGNSVAATPGQITGNSAVPVQANLSGLVPGTVYHFRCVGSNAGGTTNGLDLTFQTSCLLAGTLSAITGTSTLCAGASGIQYSVDPFTNATGYIWTLPAGATISSGANTNVITVDFSPTAETGNIIVTATDGTCNSYPSQPFPVTVNAIPAKPETINGNQIVCEGDLGISYSVNPVFEADTYIWTVPVGAVIASGLNTNAIVVNYVAGSVSGNVTVSAANLCGTSTVSDTLFVDIAPLPADAGAISGDDHICTVAQNVAYSITPLANAYDYVWNFPQGISIVSGAGTNQVTVNFAANAVSGNISVYGTNGNCIGQASPAFAVTVNPTPATPVVTLNVNTLISSADAGNQWYLEGVEIPGATAKEYLVPVAGNYTVIVTLNGCSSATSNSILVLPVSVNENPLFSSLLVYPNPSSGKFDLKAETAERLECTLEIYNKLGSLVWKLEKAVFDGSSKIHIELNDIPAGSYMLVVRNNENSLYRKLIITR